MPHNLAFQQTMLRVHDCDQTTEFYSRFFGMKVIDSKKFPEWKFDLHFMASVPEGVEVPAPGTAESNKFLWHFKGTVLELTYNYPSDSGEPVRYSTPTDVVIGFTVEDLTAFCHELESGGVRFHKKLADLHGKAAQVYDPTGYIIEITQHGGRAALSSSPLQPLGHPVLGKPIFHETRLQVHHAADKIIHFYQTHLEMKLVYQEDVADGSTKYHFATIPSGAHLVADLKSEAARDAARDASATLLVLHHHAASTAGTDATTAAAAAAGGAAPAPTLRPGYGHIGFLTDDLDPTCDEMDAAGVEFTKKPLQGKMRGLAFIKDLDGYSIEVIQRGLNT